MKIGNKTLAVIGASYLQLPLVRKAKDMGLRVVCFAWADGAVCADECDMFYPISIVEKERILEICRRERVDGVTSIASDVAVPTIAYVAEKMGLAGNSVESARMSTDKYEMRRALRDAGAPCPPFVEVSSADECEAAAGLHYPLIVKPVDRSGSMGVLEVDDSSGLRAAVETAIDCSLGKMAIVEECITDMHEISVEGLSWDGEYQILALTDKVTTGKPHYVELGHHQPAHVGGDLRNRVEDAVRKGIAALGIKCGATHAELMITGAGEILVTEIGARMGGDFIGSNLVELSTGVDFLKAVIDCALGEFSGLSRKPHADCAGVWFYAPETHWVRDVIQRHSDHPEIVESELQREDAIALTRSADRSGYFIYAGERRFEAPQNDGR